MEGQKEGYGNDLPKLISESWIVEKRNYLPESKVINHVVFKRRENDKITLNFFISGNILSKNTANTFRKLLEEETKFLSESELFEVQEILGNLIFKDQFTVLEAFTKGFDNKNCIVVHGIWKEIHKKGYHIFSDILSDGKFVEEIYFLYPEVSDKELDAKILGFTQEITLHKMKEDQN